jgi:hypothetical protein
MFTVALVLALAAFIVAVAAAANPPRAPLWLAVVLLAIAALIQSLPLH